MDNPYQCQRNAYHQNVTVFGKWQHISTEFVNRPEDGVHSVFIFDGCAEENFNASITSVCYEHVYDNSQYEYPLTAELDLSPCEGSSDYWNLEV